MTGRPDVRSPQLIDAADRLMLDHASELIPGRQVVVIGDDHGALTLGALDGGATMVLVHQDRLGAERELQSSAAARAVERMSLEPELVTGASVVLLRLPRSLDALDEVAALIAAHAAPGVTVIAGGRIKHMTVSMNAVLGRHFGRVDVSHARQKSRVLTARDPIPGPVIEPREQYHHDLGLWVAATGGVFASTGIDIGTRVMLSVLDQAPSFHSAVDLGCGTGVLAASLARRSPGSRVIATDESAAAVASARRTIQANQLDVEVSRDDAGAAIPDGSIDLVLLNPPFHDGAAVDARAALPLFRAARRMLRPGGSLWTVYNTPLGYRPTLEALVGPTRVLARTPKFLVTASTVPGRA